MTTAPYCRTHPDGYLQPADDPAWHLAPAAQAAIRACDRLCPIPIEECARDALTSGTIPGRAEPRVAAGVIQAGIVCRGDLATHQALAALAYPNGGGPEYVAGEPGDEECASCARALIPEPELVEDPTREARRATPSMPLCRACYKAAQRGGSLSPARPPTPERCGGCGQPMTTRHKPLPGHVVHEAHGHCRRCVRAASRAQASEGAAAA